MLHHILGHVHIQWHSQLIRHYSNLWPYYRSGLNYRIWPYYQILGRGFHRTLQRVQLALNIQRTLTPPDTCSWLAFVLMLRPFAPNCHVSGLRISNIHRYFYFALQWFHFSLMVTTFSATIQFMTSVKFCVVRQSQVWSKHWHSNWSNKQTTC